MSRVLGTTLLASVIVALVVSRVGPVSEPSVAPTTVIPLGIARFNDRSDTMRNALAATLARRVARALRRVPDVRIVPAAVPAGVESRQLRRLLNVGPILLLGMHDSADSIEVTLRNANDSILLRRVYTAAKISLVDDGAANEISNALRAAFGTRVVHRMRIDRSDSADESTARAWRFAANGEQPAATANALHAIALDRTTSEPHVLLGDMHRDRHEIQAADAEYQTAIRLDPQLAAARDHYARFLAERGASTEALRESRRAHELDPLDSALHAKYASMLAHVGRKAEASREVSELRRIRSILVSRNVATAHRDRAINGKLHPRGGRPAKSRAARGTSWEYAPWRTH